MADLTAAQLQAIRDLVMKHHWAFIANTVGPEAVPADILRELKQKGMVKDEPNQLELWPKQAYTYGYHLAASKDPKVAQMGMAQYHEWLRSNQVPLSQQEKNAVTWAQHNAAEWITNLGDRVRTQVVNEVVQNVQTRGSRKELASNLGHLEGTWLRDWDRVAITEKHNAMQQGYAAEIRSEYGEDQLVAKRPMPSACKHCKRLHLGPDGHPRIFPLSVLEANGTNVGRKAADWLAVVGAVHPHCQCQMIVILPGWGFDEYGDLVPGGKYGVRYNSKQDIQRAMQEESDLRKAFKLQGKTTFQGIPIAIENKAGTYRKWKDHDGNEGQTYMQYAYGYVMNTSGMDEDEIDVYLGEDPRATEAYIVHQQDPHNGVYDEDKVFLGFSSVEHAKAAYQMHFDRPDFMQAVSTVSMDQFKRWINVGAPTEGTMMKGEVPGLRLVIPLDKSLESSGNIEGKYISDQDKIGDRNPSMLAGDVVNMLFNIPKNHAPPTDTEHVREHLFEAHKEKEVSDAAYMDLESDFDVMGRVPKQVRPMGLPESYRDGLQVDIDTEEGRKRVEKRRKELEVKVGNRNQIPIGGKEADHRK